MASFNTVEAGSTPEAAFIVAVENALWGWQEAADRAIELKHAFVVANRPKGVSAERFIEWIGLAVADPRALRVPIRHRAAVIDAARTYADPSAPALAVTCSYAESSDFLQRRGRQLKRGRRQPNVYHFIGTVAS